MDSYCCVSWSTKIGKQQVDEQSIQLGPGGGALRFAGWGQGRRLGSTSGGGGRASQEKEKPAGPGNRFSALSKPEDEARSRFGAVSPARGEGPGRSGFGRQPPVTARVSQEQERKDAIAAVRSMGSSSTQSVDLSRERGRVPDVEPSRSAELPPPATPAMTALTLTEAEKKTNAIMDEYLHLLDLKEAVECVKELPEANHHHFVNFALSRILERSSMARKQTGNLLHDLVHEQHLTVDSYVKGLTEVLELAEDFEIDVPKIWQYLGELVWPMVQDGSVPLGLLKHACEPLKESNKAGVLIAEVLHDASQREGHKKVAELWLNSALKWSDFVPKIQIEQFLIDKKLEFTKGGDSAPSTPTTGLLMKDVRDNLHNSIVVSKVDNENVLDGIESNVDIPTTKQAQFVRELMTAVCERAITKVGTRTEVDRAEIKLRNYLLQKYLDHQAESELQALYALQALITRLEHPAGVLRQMFDILYDENIISKDAFLQWEKSEEEPDGKGVAMKQVVQFFTWLKEADEES